MTIKSQQSQQYVIIGGPSAGKTTIIESLKQLGYATVDDAARTLLLNKLIPRPTVDRGAFQQALVQAQLSAEQATIKSASPAFLDGGVFDGCAYYICDKLKVPNIYDSIDSSRYRKAFLLESLDCFVEDGVRYQNVDFTNAITSILEGCYLDRAVEVIRVPNLPPARRLDLILSEINPIELE